jgi:YD repeat-containing protein
VEVVTPTQTINYKYDPFGRRIEKSIVDSPQSTVNYLYDGDNLIAEYDADGNLIAKYIHGPKIDEIISLTNYQLPITSYYYHYDGLGSVTEVTDESGNVVEYYQYDIYGKVTILDTNHQPLTTSQIGNRFFFTGREFDFETGLYLL